MPRARTAIVTPFHGLVNNPIYALGVSGDELMVGTLGGLSVIGNGEEFV